MFRPKVRALLLAAWCFATSNGLGQEQIITFHDNITAGALTLAGNDTRPGQILVSSTDFWGVIRAAGDLAADFGRVTGTDLRLSNGEENAEPDKFVFEPVDITDNTEVHTGDSSLLLGPYADFLKYATNGTASFIGPQYTDPDPSRTVIIAGTIGRSTLIDGLIESGKIDVSEIEGEWESFISEVVSNPIPGCSKALVIAGSNARGTIYGLYDISEQIGVSPWYFWADVPIQMHRKINALPIKKTQGPPTVKFRGFFLNDEQPGLTNWVSNNWPDVWNDSAGYNHHFYSLVAELLLRLRANYLWPTLWGSIAYTDDPYNQPLLYAYEIVLGSSHTEPLMRAQNEFKTYYEGEWQYNENNETIDEYFRYGVQRAKPYVRNSLWTMAMRGTGDTEIEGNLGIDAIVAMLETLVRNQRQIMAEGLEVDDITTIPQLWCLYKEVQGYQEEGLEVPDDITLLWADDNWGNVRRLPRLEEMDRQGGAGVYYHFDYVGGPRDYKWINTIQLSKTTEQMQLAYARKADRIWVVNVGDLKPLEIPISHFFDMAYDASHWDMDSTEDWVRAYVAREFGTAHAREIASVITRYGRYAARRKYELVEASTYSVINYDEADKVLEEWNDLEEEAQGLYDALDEAYQPAFFQLVLHPVRGGRIHHEIYITAARNNLHAMQKRNSANGLIDRSLELLDLDAKLVQEWDLLLDGKWSGMLDQTHLGYAYWQQPMRNTLPPLSYVQQALTSLAGNVRLSVEGSNASVPGDDQWHSNSGNTLTLPPLDRYGPQQRWFEVFAAGTSPSCDWNTTVSESWVKLSQDTGTVGTESGEDTRVFVSVDWDLVPEDTPSSSIVEIEVRSPCRAWDKSKYGYNNPIIEVPVHNREIPDTFSEGFVESDGHVTIEGPHFQRIEDASSSDESGPVEYHTYEEYGRTIGGVGIVPLDAEKLSVEAAPALAYELYIFSNDTLANVTVHLSPTQNYLGEDDPLEYAIALTPAGGSVESPQGVQFVGPTEGGAMPKGWDGAVADAVWGVSDNSTTTSFQVGDPGPYTLRIWCLLPSVIVQRVLIDLGGIRPSYLGPPESFFVGRD